MAVVQETKRIIFKGEPFSLTVETRGEIKIDRQDETGVYGSVPLVSAIPVGIPELRAVGARDIITIELAQQMDWDTRRLLTAHFKVGDRELKFMYLTDNQTLKRMIEKGEFLPVYYKDYDIDISDIT